MSNQQNFEKKAKEMFDDFYKKIEGRIKDLTEQVKDNILPEAEEKLKKNVFMSMIVSFGLGFIVGIIVMLFGLGSGRKR
ncbi:MAG TPA: hypothetical protein PLE45_10645 [Spirochaetota bacterium]|nr:hypothetical protein [Spirochaetota bacterium]HPP05194.1 hypothetical protein [Spirochaetota bacterium]